MPSIAVAGHICLDITPQVRASVDIRPGQIIEIGPAAVSAGGSVANTGGVLADLGADITPFATIGADEFGTLLRSRLESRGFPIATLDVSDHLATSYSLVIEKPGLDRTFWQHTGANDEFDGTGIPVNSFDLLHVGYPSLLPALRSDHGRPLHELFARARSAGTTTSLDLAVVDHTADASRDDWKPTLRSVFSECDIASPSLDDLTSALGIDEPYSPQLVDSLSEQILAHGVAVIAISAGRHGLHLRTGSAARLRGAGRALAPIADLWADRTLTLPPYAVPHHATTNGAGDASTAGLLFAISQGASPDQALALAAACSAAVISGRRPDGDAICSIDATLAPLFTR
ncbi:carbohydrate kinase family protein [Microbacterium saperdae]|uniref:Sugar/nucleoside kinase (Ribokinase family) n=1 Tax=Microbacterium saperdae TaxID=69368 RepID=A0A543BIP0_9MICO|nr:PfkB family carbohydrate kinase [Microbacterium saperdae]TQL84694.1 sugar/nucleoside kinase (ribokinase family) [Microbacterium saperdae]GGM64899.1 hypothetical protein GCM10010489_40560 [Microbacterium saperdae]